MVSALSNEQASGSHLNYREPVVAVERFSRRLNSSDLRAISHSQEIQVSSASNTRRSIIEQQSQLLDGQLTISRLEYLATMRKSGYLFKQSKYLGRWVKRYFIITGSTVTYYDDEKLTNGKDAIITGSTNVTYTSKENCFIIKGLNDADGSQAEEWKLMADNERLVR